MKGQILEWNNGKGYRRGLLVSGKEQPKALTRQGRALVYMLDENLNLQKNENGSNIGHIVTLEETKLVGFID